MGHPWLPPFGVSAAMWAALTGVVSCTVPISYRRLKGLLTPSGRIHGNRIRAAFEVSDNSGTVTWCFAPLTTCRSTYQYAPFCCLVAHFFSIHAKRDRRFNVTSYSRYTHPGGGGPGAVFYCNPPTHLINLLWCVSAACASFVASVNHSDGVPVGDRRHGR